MSLRNASWLGVMTAEALAACAAPARGSVPVAAWPAWLRALSGEGPQREQALDKTVRDARRNLRAYLEETGLLRGEWVRRSHC